MSARGKLLTAPLATLWLIVGLTVWLIPPAGAQSLDYPGRPGQLAVSAASVPTASVTAGKRIQVEVNFRVRPGFHINSNVPGSELLMPTRLRLDPPTNILAGKTVYPAGKEMSFSFAPQEKMQVYSGDFATTTQLSAARNTPPGTYRVRMELQYQACDDRACYNPSKLPVSVDVKVLRARPGRSRRNPAQSPHAR